MQLAESNTLAICLRCRTGAQRVRFERAGRLRGCWTSAETLLSIAALVAWESKYKPGSSEGCGRQPARRGSENTEGRRNCAKTAASTRCAILGRDA